MLVAMSAFAVVPVKALLKSKTRLSNFFTPQERQLFTLAMLEDVLNALKSSGVDENVVVGSDEAVEEFVKSYGMVFLREEQEGLNQALNQAMKWCAARHARAVLTLPADVPTITTRDVNRLVGLAMGNSIVISPSHNGGTNAFLQTPPGIVPPSFGSESFGKHLQKASARQVRVRIFVSANIMLDIDYEADLEKLLKVGQHTASHRFLKQVAWKSGCRPFTGKL